MPGQRMQMQLDELARMDELTGVLNRRAFNRRLRDEPQGASGCVLLLDVDRFKRLNDQHGHAAGDAVLRAFAGTVTAQLRREDVFARFGGDEFSVLLPTADMDQACAVAERIRLAIETMEVDFGDLTLKVTASIGAAPLAGDNLDHSLAEADMALYRAKSLGRNRVECGEDAG
jgi:diguanylate cyclase (GGDEF)-like protein